MQMYQNQAKNQTRLAVLDFIDTNEQQFVFKFP